MPVNFPTTGFYRVSNVTARMYGGVGQQVVPGASIYVTETATDLAATIYSDPVLTAPIDGSVVVTDVLGGYSYYIPLNYMVSETISAPNGGSITIPNIGINGPLVGTLTTTAAASDTVSITGILATSHVSLAPTNAAAAAMSGLIYVSAKAAGSVTITHPVTAGATFDLIITPY